MNPTLTLTQTIPAAAMATLNIRQAGDPRVFLNKMLVNNLFSEEEKQLIHDLIESLNSENSASLLILFLSDIVFPAVEISEDENKLSELEALVSEVHKLLKPLLPPHVDIEAYINDEIERNNTELALLTSAQKIAELMEKKDEELCAIGNQINEDIDQMHELLKKRLLQMIQVKEIASANSTTKNNDQVERINRIQSELTRIVEEFKKMGADYKQTQIHYQQLLKRSYELIRSIKH